MIIILNALHFFDVIQINNPPIFEIVLKLNKLILHFLRIEPLIQSLFPAIPDLYLELELNIMIGR